MASSFSLSIVTPERTVLSTDAVSLQVPSVGGSMGVLAGHAPMLAQLGVGECVVRLESGEQRELAIAGGFLDVTRTRVTVLADTAEFADEIDVNRAEASLGKARALLESLTGADRAEAAESIRKAQARIRVAGRSER